MLRSLTRILRASLVQIDTEMTEKYSNQRYAVDML